MQPLRGRRGQGEHTPAHAGQHRPRDGVQESRRGDHEAAGGGLPERPVEEGGRQGGQSRVERPAHNRRHRPRAHRRSDIEIGAQPLLQVAHLVAVAEGHDLGVGAIAHDGDDLAPRVDVGEQRGVGGEAVAERREVDPRVDARRADRCPLPLAGEVTQLCRARAGEPVAGGILRTEHAKLGERVGQLRVRRRPQRNDLLAQMPCALGPFEDHLGRARAHRRTQPGEDEARPVHGDRGLQIDAAERALPRSEAIQPRRRVSAGFGRASACGRAGGLEFVGEQPQVHRSGCRHPRRRGGRVARTHGGTCDGDAKCDRLAAEAVNDERRRDIFRRCRGGRPVLIPGARPSLREARPQAHRFGAGGPRVVTQCPEPSRGVCGDPR